MLSLNYLDTKKATRYYDVVAKPVAGKAAGSPADYYLQKSGEWFGKGAKFLGLEGAVYKSEFQNLLEGRTPDGYPLVQSGQNEHHRPGYDYTFSAPKSLSIIAEVMADQDLKDELYKAHVDSVKTVLTFLEDNYAQARQTKSGVTEVVKTGNLTFALFTENTSREHDPQVHTHAVIFNVTKRADGKFRAMMNEPLHNHKMFLGQLYRNELSLRLAQLGFGIETRSKGLFEIAGISQELLDEYSTRSKQISQAMKDLQQKYPEMNEAKLREMAAIMTRRKKETLSKEDLQKDWQKRLSSHIKNPSKYLKHLRGRAKKKALQANHIDVALDILTEEESVVTREELLYTALKLSLGEKSLPALEKDMTDSKLIRTIKKNALYTTSEIEHIERDITQHISRSRETLPNIISKHAWLELLVQAPYKRLTGDQQKALQFILTESNDQVIAIQGDAGTGKTTMLELAAKQYTRTGYEVITLGPTARAVEELNTRGLPNAQTIDHFLLSPKTEESKSARLFIIDEASMLGSKKFRQILDRTKTRDKIVLVGDAKQKQSISQGGIFTKLQKHKVIKTARMKENVRQKDDLMRETVTHLAEKDVRKAFDALSGNDRIQEVQDSTERLQLVADQFVEDYKDGNTLAVIETNSERKELNQMIRQQLIDNRAISKRSTTLSISQPKSIRGAERNLAGNYAVDDFFFLQKELLGMPAGAEGRITEMDTAKNSILAEISTKGKKKYITLDLSRYGHHLSTYTKEMRGFAKGDKIVFLKNDKKLGVQNGTTGKVLHVSKHYIRVLTDSKKIVTFQPKSYPYFDLGYATTIYKSQGLTTTKVLYIADTRNHLDFNSLYVAATRATDHLTIYTNDHEQLLDKVQIEQNKTSTLDYSLEGLERELTIEEGV